MSERKVCQRCQKLVMKLLDGGWEHVYERDYLDCKGIIEPVEDIPKPSGEVQG